MCVCVLIYSFDVDSLGFESTNTSCAPLGKLRKLSEP